MNGHPNPPRRQNPLLSPPQRPLPGRVAIVGAGTIGPDIGYYLKSTIADLGMVLVDVAREPLDAALKRIEAHVEKGLARGKLTEDRAASVTTDLVPTLDLEEIAGCDWVIEAASEDLDLKRGLFDRIEAIVGDETVITSNTSSLPAERLFSGLRRPGRATVTHFFAPAFQNPVVEVVDWAAVDPGLVDHLRWVFCATGKVPLVTEDAVCFMLDRVFDNWCNEAALLLDRATAAQIDTVARELVHAGPFQVLNLARGNPIIIETNTLQMREEGDQYRPAAVLRSVDRWATPRDAAVEVDVATAALVRDRLLGVLFSQTVDILDRGIGVAPDLELGCRLALGFEVGPLALMDELGEEEVDRILVRFVADRPGMPTPAKAIPSYVDFARNVLVDEIDGVVVITIRRPQALNALDDDVTDEILDVISRHESDPGVVGFVITGYGSRAFCAGADIDRFPPLLGHADAAARYARDCSRLLVHLDAMHKPVVAAVNGMALGGGLELAFRCHGLVAMGDARLRLPEVTLGIAPGLGAMVVPYRRWPAASGVLADMNRYGRELTAADARELGIVDAVAPDIAGLVSAAIDRVRALSEHDLEPIPDGPVELGVLDDGEAPAGEALDPEVVGIIDRAIRAAAAAPTLGDALEIGYRAFGASACTAAASENITAFVTRGAKGG